MHKPKISVLMSVYNGAKYLEESIASLLGQTFPDFELILIDDGSTDHSLKIIKRFAQCDHRIRILINPQNLGLTRALNRGLKKARGKYIARQDADDLSLPMRLATQYHYLEKNPQVFLVGSSAMIINHRGQVIGCYRKSNLPGEIARKLARKNQIIHSSITFRNQKILYREKFQYAQDYDFFLRLLSQKKIITNLAACLIQYRYQPQSLTLAHYQKQLLFARQAKTFYQQREKYRYDNYDAFNAAKLLQKDESWCQTIWLLKVKLALLNLKHRKWKAVSL